MRNAALVVAVPVVLPRAVVMWGLTRLLLAVLPLAGGLKFGSIPPAPIGVVLLSGVVGFLDVRGRREGLLWANLGVPSATVYAIYVVAAIPAEFILAFVSR